MPLEVYIHEEHQLRTHLRAVHKIILLSPTELQQYRISRPSSNGRHSDYQNDHHRVNSGVNLTANEFSVLINQVQQSIHSGVERGIAMAFNTSSAINHYAGVRSGGNCTPPRCTVPIDFRMFLQTPPQINAGVNTCAINMPLPSSSSSEFAVNQPAVMDTIAVSNRESVVVRNPNPLVSVIGKCYEFQHQPL